MNRGALAVLLVLGIGLLAVLMFAGVGWWWWTQHGPQFTSDAIDGMKQGEAFGKQTHEDGCLNEAFNRNRKHPETEAGFGNLMFLTGCLIEADASPGFCEGVPSQWNTFAASRWIEQRCETQQLDTPGCAGMLNIVVGHCQSIAQNPDAK